MRIAVGAGIYAPQHALARILGGAEFRAALTQGLTISRGTGSQTITRATTHTVQNNDGFLVTCLAGEIPIKGGRRVDNLIRLGAAQSATLAVAANVTMTLPAGQYVFSMGVGTGRATFSGTGGATGTLDASASARVSVSKTVTAGTLIVTASVATLTDLQVESVDAQTTKTAGEYVSVGVPSDWLGTELVTNGTFDTATTGWTGYASATLSAVSGELEVKNGATDYAIGAYAFSTVVGARYVATGVGRVGTTSLTRSTVGTGPGAADIGIVSITSATNVPAKIEFTATATTTYIGLINQTNTINHTSYFDNISVKPAIYHGAGVDGVKWFSTDISGNPIATATLDGAEVWPAATNLCLQSQDWATTWTVQANVAVAANNTTAPDGTATADKLTSSTTGTSNVVIFQGVTLATSSTYVLSMYAKAGSQGSKFTIYLRDATSGDTGGAAFNQNTGAYVNNGGSTGLTIVGYSSESVGNGWYRYYVAVTTGLNAGCQFSIRLNDLSGQVSGDNLYVWGAQVELGSFATPYIPTTTAAVTRNASVISVPTASNIASAAGFIALEYTPQHAPSGTVYLWGTYVDANNSTQLLENQATNLCLQSNAFTTAPWGYDLDAVSQNAIGPDGAVSAWTTTDSSAVAAKFFQSGAMTLTAAPWTTSIFVKKTSGATSFPVCYMVTGYSVATITIDTNNGIATPWTAYTGLTIVPCTTVVSDFNEDYWRVAFTFTATAAVWAFTVYVAGTTNATQSTGTIDTTAQGSAVFYGAQVELGSYATPYIATTTAATTQNFLIFRKRIAGVNYDASIRNEFVSGTTYKMAASWGAGGTNIALGGTLGTPHTNTTAAQIGTTMQTGGDGNGASQAGMAIKNEYIGQRALSTAELLLVTQ